MTTIRLTNSKTRRKEEFVPLDPANVRMYVCGPTVYDRAHLGNARPVVVFDTLYRLLRHVYGADHVTYVRNFTDVDDKINAEAQRRKALGRPETLEELIRERTEETIAWYHADMDALGALRPGHEPRATEFIGAMIAMIEGLIGRGHAYAVDGHVLFRVRSYKDYGALSGRSVDDMIAGARVEVAPYKEDPMDFVLWKPSDADLPGWDSPWGRGRPGWHIECSAMSYELLGDSFDIHGGGLDLQFPHHENEIAQSCCAHPQGQFARYWLHNEMLQVEGKKMSKSLGNFFTVRDLLNKGIPGEVIRFVLLSTHYRKPMDWRRGTVTAARKELRNWWFATEEVKLAAGADDTFVDALADDLNTSDAINRLRELYKAKEFSKLRASANLLGLLLPGTDPWFRPKVDDLVRGKVESVFALRQRVRAEKDYVTSDFLRAVLEVAGVTVADGKNPTWIASFAGQERGWKKLAELSEDESERFVNFDSLASIARSRHVWLSSEIDSNNNLTDGHVVIVDEVPETIDVDLLYELVRVAGYDV
ncbi:cysteine--tRNA ligase [Pseudogemmobacter blasticus]|uniref:Cysteine--tRNA ligase n=1 Tax=Fuscovulum blasticum DSM 2131 TaxID=1188250 RepID=A0A2T4J5H9_FUSBL|nr:cysteine--tRNA ligase [Fuscovulum blasticum]PTE13125.1 cysteine--tRNA ligase [Fuscovulum blasticum DSM 2131]